MVDNENNNNISRMEQLRKEALADTTSKGDAREKAGARHDRRDIIYSKRYDRIMPGLDMEDFYGRQQSHLQQLGRGTVKGVGMAATSFLEGTVGLAYGVVSAIDNRDLNKLFNNSITQSLDSLTDALDTYLPNYYTLKERNAKWYSTDTWLTGNFWGESVLQTTGYSIGAFYSGGVWTKMLATTMRSLSAVSAGVNAIKGSAELMKVGSRTRKLVERAQKIEKSLNQARKANDTVRIGQIQKELQSLEKSLYQIKKVNELVPTYTRAVMATASEAGMEARLAETTHREKLIDKYVEEHGYAPPEEIMNQIDDIAKKVGKGTYFANLGLLTVTNSIQFPLITGQYWNNLRRTGRATERSLGKMSIVNKDGKVIRRVVGNSKNKKNIADFSKGEKYVSAGAMTTVGAHIARTKAGRFVNALSPLSKTLFSGTQAFEAFSQRAIPNIFGDYFDAENVGEDTLWYKSFWDGVQETYNSKDGMVALLSGGISGGLMRNFTSPLTGGRFFDAYKKHRDLRSNTEKFVSDINKTHLGDYMKDMNGSLKRAKVLEEQMMDAVERGDKLNFEDITTDQELNYFLPRIQYGRAEMVHGEIDMLFNKASTDEGFAELQEAGYVGENTTRSEYQQNLLKLKTRAKNAEKNLQHLNDRYGDILDSNGQRQYSAKHIQKMAYLMSKIQDYDARIPKRLEPFNGLGIDVNSLLTTLTDKDYTENEIKEILNDLQRDIRLKSDTEFSSDDLTEQLAEIIELQSRRILAVEQYELMRDKPELYSDSSDIFGGLTDVVGEDGEVRKTRAYDVASYRVDPENNVTRNGVPLSDVTTETTSTESQNQTPQYEDFDSETGYSIKDGEVYYKGKKLQSEEGQTVEDTIIDHIDDRKNQTTQKDREELERLKKELEDLEDSEGLPRILKGYESRREKYSKRSDEEIWDKWKESGLSRVIISPNSDGHYRRLDSYINEHGNRATKFIWDIIKNTVEKSEVSIFPTSFMEKDEVGKYEEITGSIDIDETLIFEPEQLAQTMVHELAHAVTTDVIKAISENNTETLSQYTPEQIEAGRGLIRILETIQNSERFKDTYGAKNIYEMLAELSDPAFQKALEKYETDRKIDSGKQGFLKRIAKRVLGIFGYKETPKRSLYDEAVRLFQQLLSSDFTQESSTTDKPLEPTDPSTDTTVDSSIVTGVTYEETETSSTEQTETKKPSKKVLELREKIAKLEQKIEDTELEFEAEKEQVRNDLANNRIVPEPSSSEEKPSTGEPSVFSRIIADLDARERAGEDVSEERQQVYEHFGATDPGNPTNQRIAEKIINGEKLNKVEERYYKDNVDKIEELITQELEFRQQEELDKIRAEQDSSSDKEVFAQENDGKVFDYFGQRGFVVFDKDNGRLYFQKPNGERIEITSQDFLHQNIVPVEPITDSRGFTTRTGDDSRNLTVEQKNLITKARELLVNANKRRRELGEEVERLRDKLNEHKKLINDKNFSKKYKDRYKDLVEESEVIQEIIDEIENELRELKALNTEYTRIIENPSETFVDAVELLRVEQDFLEDYQKESEGFLDRLREVARDYRELLRIVSNQVRQELNNYLFGTDYGETPLSDALKRALNIGDYKNVAEILPQIDGLNIKYAVGREGEVIRRVEKLQESLLEAYNAKDIVAEQLLEAMENTSELVSKVDKMSRQDKDKNKKNKDDDKKELPKQPLEDYVPLDDINKIIKEREESEEPITKEELQEQYPDIPEDRLDEFVDDINDRLNKYINLLKFTEKKNVNHVYRSTMLPPNHLKNNPLYQRFHNFLKFRDSLPLSVKAKQRILLLTKNNVVNMLGQDVFDRYFQKDNRESYFKNDKERTDIDKGGVIAVMISKHEGKYYFINELGEPIAPVQTKLTTEQANAIVGWQMPDTDKTYETFDDIPRAYADKGVDLDAELDKNRAQYRNAREFMMDKKNSNVLLVARFTVSKGSTTRYGTEFQEVPISGRFIHPRDLENNQVIFRMRSDARAGKARFKKGDIVFAHEDTILPVSRRRITEEEALNIYNVLVELSKGGKNQDIYRNYLRGVINTADDLVFTENGVSVKIGDKTYALTEKGIRNAVAKDEIVTELQKKITNVSIENLNAMDKEFTQVTVKDNKISMTTYPNYQTFLLDRDNPKIFAHTREVHDKYAILNAEDASNFYRPGEQDKDVVENTIKSTLLKGGLFDVSGNTVTPNPDVPPPSETLYETLVNKFKKRREKGEYTKDGVTYKRKKVRTNIRGLVGKKGKVKFSNKVESDFVYMVVDANDLQPSHLGGNENPAFFMPEMQPKFQHRSSETSSIDQQRQIAERPNFEELGANVNAYTGAPLINDHHEVIQGNNRGAGLRQHYRETGERNSDYKAELIKRADEFGLDPDAVASVETPVLVRHIPNKTENQYIELGNYDVTDIETGTGNTFNPNRLARTLDKGIKNKLVELIQPDPNTPEKTLNQSIRDNRVQIRDILKNVVPDPSQVENLFKGKELTPNGIERISELYTEMLFSSTMPGMKNILNSVRESTKNALIKSLPYLLSMDKNNSLIETINKSAELLHNIKTTQPDAKDGSFQSYLNSTDIFDPAPKKNIYGSNVIIMAHAMENYTKQKDLIDAIKAYTLDTTKTDDLFSAFDDKELLTREQALAEHFTGKMDDKFKSYLGIGGEGTIENNSTKKSNSGKNPDIKIEC